MKRFVFGVLDILVMLAILAVGVTAVPDVAAASEVGPYEGEFQGVVYGDEGSRAPLSLDLTHRGNRVEGDLILGTGLTVDGGMCGTVDLPANVLFVEGETIRGNSKRLIATPTFDAGGFEVTVDFESNVIADGKLIVAKATVDLPWFCGRAPALTGVLYRN